MSKRILVLTPRLPYPVIGGDKLRIYNICSHLRDRGHRLTLASFVECEKEALIARTDPAGTIFEKILPVVLGKHSSYLQTLLGMTGKLPLQLRYYHSRRMHALVSEELAGERYDTLLCHLIRMAPYASHASSGERRVLEMTDALSLNYTRSMRIGRWGLFPLLYRFEQPRVLAYERECLRAFDATVLVSPVDRDYLRRHHDCIPDLAPRIITNGVDERFLRVDSSGYDPRQIIFIGNMRTFQNLDAVIYFIKEVFPLLRKREPAATFKVIGTDAPPSLLRYNRVPGITITGRVSSIQEHAAAACASVCPVRIAAGVQNKILESMAMGIPVITTATGLEGIPARDNEELLVADDPPSMATALQSVMRDHDLRARIGTNAKKFILQHYCWSVQLTSYEELL